MKELNIRCVSVNSTNTSTCNFSGNRSNSILTSALCKVFGSHFVHLKIISLTKIF